MSSKLHLVGWQHHTLSVLLLHQVLEEHVPTWKLSAPAEIQSQLLIALCALETQCNLVPRLPIQAIGGLKNLLSETARHTKAPQILCTVSVKAHVRQWVGNLLEASGGLDLKVLLNHEVGIARQEQNHGTEAHNKSTAH